jgi:hypothetical protein
MSRKNRRNAPVSRPSAVQPARNEADAVIDKRGLIFLAAALVLVCAGYFFLTSADPAGRNLYSILSPLFLLAGYLLVPAALISPRAPGRSEDK